MRRGRARGGRRWRSRGSSLLAAGCGGGTALPSVARSDRPSSADGTRRAARRTAGLRREPASASFVAFAACMTAHGHPPRPVGADGPASRSPQADRWSRPSSCRRTAGLTELLPGGGPPALAPAQEAERAKGLAGSPAACAERGVPSFLDPNGQGQFPFAAHRPSSIRARRSCRAAYEAYRSLFPSSGRSCGSVNRCASESAVLREAPIGPLPRDVHQSVAGF